ncbi:MAG: terpene cyclase/mutase family protein [Pirellulales bacterium]|nr:terpene cyclase/mutase family protein [Pirellulales bacterium]
MSGPEPRLPDGEGLAEVPVAPPPDVSLSAMAPLGGKPVPPVLPGALPDVSAGKDRVASAEAPPQAPEDRDGLPPLIAFGDLVFDAPPWLFSAVLHMIAVIVLGLIFIVPESTDALLLRFDYSESHGEDLMGDDLDVSLELLDEQLDSELAPQKVLELEQAAIVETTDLPPLLLDQPASASAAAIQMALTGREKGMQQNLLEAYGGTGATQQAVMEGLRWLARNQGRQGMWSMRGGYADGTSVENREAATGMALIAFQGAGYTPQSDPHEPFTEVVSRAWKTLLKKQKEDGDFFHEGRGHSHLYTHAICTIALCELYGMTRNSKYREPAQRAVDYCVKIQSEKGGWRYFPGTGSDLSVTGWFVMALQSARMAGLEVPSSTLDRVSEYLNSVSREGGVFYSYQPSSGATQAMTAEGLLCRQYLGWKQSDWRLQRGGNYLVRNLPVWEDDERDVYYWYYATQVCHHLEGAHWRTWNEVMRVVLPAHQVQDGKERGSWDPDGDEWGDQGGRLYVTCLSIYMLEVYYRHLPIHQLNALQGRLN